MPRSAELCRRPASQLHVDAAVGWFITVLNEYDVDANPFGLDEKTLPLIRSAQEHSQQLRYADSVTIDFHKLGWGHYPARVEGSLFQSQD